MTSGFPGRRLAAGTLAGIFGMGAGYAAQFAFSVAVARILGPELGGLFFGMHAIAVFAALLARLGLDRLSLRDVAALDESGLASVARTTAGRRTIIVAVVGLTLAASIAVASHISRSIVFYGEQQGAFLLVLGAVPLLAIAILSASFLRALERILLSAAAQLLIVYGGGAIVLFAAPDFFAGDLGRVALLFLILSMVASAAGLGSFHRVVASRRDTGRTAPLQVDWRVPAHMMAVAVMTYFVSGADIMLLGILAPPEQVTLYVAASRTVLGVSLGLVGINSIAGSLLSRAFHRGDIDEMRQICRSTASWGAFSALLTGVVLLGLAPVIFRVFGVDQVTGIFLFLLLWSGQTANSAVGPVVLVAQMSGHEKDVTGILLVSAAIALIGYAVLIPRFGAYGAAVSSAVSMVLWNCGLALRLRTRLGVSAWPSRLVAMLVLWALSALIFGLSVSVATWWWRPAVVVTVAVSAAVMLLDRGERRTILRYLNLLSGARG